MSNDELHAAAASASSRRNDNHGFDVSGTSSPAPAPQQAPEAPGIIRTVVHALVGVFSPSKASAEKETKDSDLPKTFAASLALLKSEQAIARTLEETPSTPKVQELRAAQNARVDRIRTHMHILENSGVVDPPVTDPFRRKVTARIAAHPAVNDLLKLATEAATNHHAMVTCHEFDLDAKHGVQRIGLLLRDAGPLDPKAREAVIQKLRDLSIPAIASLLQDEARRNCQVTLETVTACVTPLLEAAIPVARQIAEEVRADEAKFDSTYGLPHQPRQALVAAQEVVSMLEQQLKAIADSNHVTRMTMPADPFTYCIGLLNNPA
jgi:hypothetical protein